MMMRNNSLLIRNTSLAHTGHYLCTGVNEAGAAIERSQLLVYDVHDWDTESRDHHLDSYHLTPTTDVAEARVVLMEKTVDVESCYPESGSSFRLSWRISQPHKYIEGYLIYYREKRPRDTFTSIKVHHARATSYTINRLKASTTYEVFIVPFFKSVLGMPSVSVTVNTLDDPPSLAPRIHNVTLLGDSLFIHWLPLDQRHSNGVLEGYKIIITSSTDHSVLVDVLVSPSESSRSVVIPHLATSSLISVSMSAVNKAGSGPGSEPVVLDLSVEEQGLVNMNMAGGEGGGVWVGALCGSLTLFIVCLGVVILLRQRQHSAKHQAYLSTSTTEETLREKDETLWIDRRWTSTDCHDGSFSSDKKLLQQRSVCENEYTYIDQATLHNMSRQLSCAEASQFHDLAPYASTDILRNKIPTLYQVGGNNIHSSLILNIGFAII